jgi:hypothetical protein
MARASERVRTTGPVVGYLVKGHLQDWHGNRLGWRLFSIVEQYLTWEGDRADAVVLISEHRKPLYAGGYSLGDGMLFRGGVVGFDKDEAPQQAREESEYWSARDQEDAEREEEGETNPARLPSSRISPSKARRILHEGEVRGYPLTPAQRGMFGAAASRNPDSKHGFVIGDRVQLHPATDDWMRGDRYGEVVGFGKLKTFMDRATGGTVGAYPIRVKLDKSGRVKAFNPDDLSPVE